MAELNRHTDPTWFIEGLNAADGSVYLGDINVARTILNNFAKDIVARIAKVQANQMTEKEALEADRAQALNTANIFVGNTAGFSVLPGWNDFALPRWIQNVKGLAKDETDPALIVAHAMARFAISIYQAFDKGGKDAEIAARVQSSVESMAQWMLGVEGND